MILGNLLNQAATVVPFQSFSYYKYTTRSVNAAGFYNATYADSVTLKGSVQAVPRSMYEKLGLDFQKKYVNIFVSQNLVDVKRDVSGDQVEFDGERFQCESLTPWFAMDGWVQILCVKVD